MKKENCQILLKSDETSNSAGSNDFLSNINILQQKEK